MASLGGARAVQTACESVLHDRQAPLEIRFRPDDPLARGLCAERVDVNGLVLRVSRPAPPPRPLASTRSRASPASSTSRPSPTFSTPRRDPPRTRRLVRRRARLRPRILRRERESPREEGTFGTSLRVCHPGRTRGRPLPRRRTRGGGALARGRRRFARDAPAIRRRPDG